MVPQWSRWCPDGANMMTVHENGLYVNTNKLPDAKHLGIHSFSAMFDLIAGLDPKNEVSRPT